MKHYNSNQNPWAGLSSYEDPAKSELKLKFCGRDNETKEVTRLIDDNFFVTLYGKSGIGKTSLLNAGVFPALRREQYTPLRLRLGMTDEALTYQNIITTAIERAIEECGGSVRVINVVDEQADRSAIDYLWNWFARHCFLNADGQTTFPVIVFDQFEEVFRHPKSRQKTEVLLTQLHYLIDESHALNDCIVNGEQYYYDFNFRFVLSIREDDLYRLEDSIDNCALTALKHCRYRLRSLSKQSAEAVILIPGEGLFKEEDKKGIVDTIINIARNKEDKSISTNVLSLICSRIFVDFKKSGTDHITPALVDSFIKGNPFERFYNEATHDFSNKEKSYIEDNLVDSTGRRNSIPESNFLLHVPKGQQLLEGDARILQRTSTSSDGGNYRIELIHDSFCEPLSKQKEKRERRKRLRWLASVSGMALLCLGIIAYILYQINRINSQENTIVQQDKELLRERDSLRRTNERLIMTLQNLEIVNIQKDSANVLLSISNKNLLLREKALLTTTNYLRNTTERLSINESRILAEQANILIDDGDSYLARLISLQALPPRHPYTKEAEAALRKASLQNNAILKGHMNGIFFVSFSPDGQRAISASMDNTIRIWDVKTGSCLKEIYVCDEYVYSALYSNDGKTILSASGDNIIRLWDAETGKCLKTFVGHTRITYFASFSHKGDKIVSASLDETARVWDVRTGKCTAILTGPKGFMSGYRIQKAFFSPDDKCIVTSHLEGPIRIWDSKNGKCIKLIGKEDEVMHSASYSPEGNNIVSTIGYNGNIAIWNAEEGVLVTTLKGHTNNVESVSYTNDGKYIVSTSEDKTIRLWDVNNSACIRVFSGHTDKVTCAELNNERTLIISGSFDNTVRLWDMNDEWQIGLNGCRCESAIFTPDGKHIVAGYSDSVVRIWNVQTKKCVKILSGHNKTINKVSVNPSGQLIASASDDKTIKIWNLITGDCIYTFNVLWNDVVIVGGATTALFSPDGKYLLSESWSSDSLQLWNLSTGKIFRYVKGRLNNSFGYNNSTPFSIKTKTFAVFVNHNVTLINYESGKMVKEFHLDKDLLSGSSIYFSPIGNILAITNDKKIILWDVINDCCFRVIEGHNKKVTSLSFASNGKYIVSGDSDGTILVWDIETGFCLTKIRVNCCINSCVFSPNDKRILVASSDGFIRIWNFPPLQELIDETHERFNNRQLTPEERRKYYLE